MDSELALLKELLEFFVGPLLPLSPSSTEAPIHEQQQVATQIHAVVMLYNYYHRKQHPEVEFLCFEEFSELAISLKPSLRAHMKLKEISNSVIVDGQEPKVSVTEKAIMDACYSCLHLDASKEEPVIEGWPVSGVAVLLTDLTKQSCLLEIHSTIQGVWSPMEKSLDNLPAAFVAEMEKKPVERKRKRKRREMKKPATDASNVDENMFLQLALYAVKEASGIGSSELVVLESHNVYSLHKARSIVRFYIMQYNRPLGEDIACPIEQVLNSMQGPLVVKNLSDWLLTSVVEYFLMLPYASIMAKRFSSHNYQKEGSFSPIRSTGRDSIDLDRDYDPIDLDDGDYDADADIEDADADDDDNSSDEEQ